MHMLLKFLASQRVEGLDQAAPKPMYGRGTWRVLTRDELFTAPILRVQAGPLSVATASKEVNRVSPVTGGSGGTQG